MTTTENPLGAGDDPLAARHEPRAAGDKPPSTTVYTDGACSGNPGPGGWAWAVPDGSFAAGAEPRTTNQRMEIQAALEALRAIDGPVLVMSDSTYVVNCFRDRWWEGWIAKGWKNSQRKPVANRDLWEPLIALVRARVPHIRFEWVKGHGDDQMNDLVDRLAVEAALTQQPRTGDRPPTDLGPPDRPGRGRSTPSATSAADPPAGHKVVIAGARPPALGGYQANPTAARVEERLAEILAAKRAVHPELVVLTGLGLGAEQLGATAAASAGVPFVAVLPYPDPDTVWPPASRERFAKLLAGAADQIVVSDRPPATKQAAGAALARRDAWLARHADEAVVVWDGEDPAVGRLVRSLQDHVGEEEVWVVEP